MLYTPQVIYHHDLTSLLQLSREVVYALERAKGWLQKKALQLHIIWCAVLRFASYLAPCYHLNDTALMYNIKKSGSGLKHYMETAHYMCALSWEIALARDSQHNISSQLIQHKSCVLLDDDHYMVHQPNHHHQHVIKVIVLLRINYAHPSVVVDDDHQLAANR